MLALARIAGLSMGGYGTWELAPMQPQRLKHLPVWIFHGAKDDVVPPRESREISIALKAISADVRYTEFPEANHNSWDPAYSQTPELWSWLFA